MKEYEANSASINVNGKEIYGFGDDSIFDSDDITSEKYPYRLILSLKPEAMKHVYVGADVSSKLDNENWARGKVAKIDGNQVICKVSIPIAFIKKHHISLEALMKGITINYTKEN